MGPRRDDPARSEGLAMLRAVDPLDEERVERHLADGGSQRIEEEARRRASNPQVPSGLGRPRARLIGMTAAAGAVVILLVVAGIRVGGDEARERPTGLLASFAALASAQERPGPFEFIDWEYQWAHPNGIDRTIRIWSGADERYEERVFEVGGRPEGADSHYFNRAAQVSCAPDGQGRSPSCEQVDVNAGAVPGRDPWVELWFEAPQMPTDSAELRSVLEEQIRAEYEAGIYSGTPTTGPLDGVSGFGPSGPLDKLEPSAQHAIYTRELFAKLIGLLSNPYAPPELRGASFELLGQLEGIGVREGVRDGAGREATRLSFARPWPFGHPPPRNERYQLFLDPKTSQVLELRLKRGDKLVITERVIKRRAVGELPPEATSLREAAQAYEPPPPEPEPEPLPAATPAPDVILSSGGDWEVAITWDRAIEMRREDGRGGRTYGFTMPPTLAEAEIYRPPSRGRRSHPIAKVLAGPVSDEVAAVTVQTPAGEEITAEIVDAFDLRWFWVELERGQQPVTITARDSSGTTVTERRGRRVVVP